MRAFACPNCSALIFYENSVCVTCGFGLGFVRSRAEFVTVRRTDDGSIEYRNPDGTRLVPCANLGLASCNWLTQPDAPGGLCSCCSLTRTRPADTDEVGLASFARTETAKRRLLFQLDRLALPTTPRAVDPEHGLAFDLLSSLHQPVVTGHRDGVITIDLAEGDDQHRESVRASLGEPYRTLLGHLRHEIGHAAGGQEIAAGGQEIAAGGQEIAAGGQEIAAGGSNLDAFRELFGDERADYGAALARHYAAATPTPWRLSYISGYAAAHPWEDWAECFAHYLHMSDTLQTAAAYGVRVDGPDLKATRSTRSTRSADTAGPANVAATPSDGYVDFDQMLESWFSLTYALNAVNRSMGKDDLYPFLLVPTVIAKLRFVHAKVLAAG